MISDSSPASGEDGGSFCSGAGCWFAREDARRVELEVDDEVESSGISTTFQVCNVASGAKDTRRFASEIISYLRTIERRGIETDPLTFGALPFVQEFFSARDLSSLSQRPFRPEGQMRH